jgi:hypothetical protein
VLYRVALEPLDSAGTRVRVAVVPTEDQGGDR